MSMGRSQSPNLLTNSPRHSSSFSNTHDDAPSENMLNNNNHNSTNNNNNDDNNNNNYNNNNHRDDIDQTSKSQHSSNHHQRRHSSHSPDQRSSRHPSDTAGDRGGGGKRSRDDQRRRRRSESRSRSRGRNRVNRNISSSRERSRERERRRRRMQAECIRRAGGFQKLADSEGREPVRLFWDGFQWVAKTGHSTALQSDPALMNSTRKLRRLYFGNLPLHLGLTETLFQELVWIEMRNRGFCNSPNENPVLCVWFAKDKGNYGFVEFSSVDETERALTMDGMNCMGVPLKVSRPNDYTAVATTQPQTQTMALMGQQSAQLLVQQTSAAEAAVQMGGGILAGLLPSLGNPVGQPSTVVRFKEMVKVGDLEEGDTWRDFLEDIKTGCSSHGVILSGVILTPQNKGNSPYAIGDVFLEFSSSAEADKCVEGMTGRRYLERVVNLSRMEEAVYTQLIKPLGALM